MTTAKNRCTNCKKYFPSEGMIAVIAGKFHSKQCLIEYGISKSEQVIKKAKKNKKKTNAKLKRDYYKNDLKTRKAAAKAACHAYIKARDKGNPCICCGRSLAGKPARSVHAGHFHESGNNPLIRYDEDNIHLQSGHCNQFQGGDSGNYRENLINKIGIERVERLDKLKGGTLKRTAADYLEIEKYYKEKIKVSMRIE